MRAGRARHVEGGFHCGPRRGRETPAKRNVKDKIKVKINGIKRRQVGESVERFSATFFDGLNERDNLVDRCFIQDAAWLPEDERQLLPKQNVSGKFQIIPRVDATVFSSLHQLKIYGLPALVEPGFQLSVEPEQGVGTLARPCLNSIAFVGTARCFPLQ